ncbi:DUF1801 domain-containing protein [Pelomonas sp. KK5]|uniref:DUF1801 domain-containing protein n=1 Tax=Pelomonas sp. KK5 TaxID=1855730 RepID=UPI00097CB25B|nr:DUF1801 domain-containing protein [Pelomonas sp. KK5]
MKSAASPPASAASPAEQLEAFIAKFEPATAALIRECRAELQALLPTAIELVYDNYNFFVIGYCATERPSSCVVSLAAAANGVGLSFYRGASLPDPEQLLQGSGKQNRFVRLPSAETLRIPGVLALIAAAVALAEPPLPARGGGLTVIQSVSAKQRPRRKAQGKGAA